MEPAQGDEEDEEDWDELEPEGSGNIQPVEDHLSGVSYVQPMVSATGTVWQVGIPDSYHRIRLKSLLTKIIGVPGILQAMLEWQQREGSTIQDMFDGEFCKKHLLNKVSMRIG